MDAVRMTAQDSRKQPGRRFNRFKRWPLVPDRDLYQLRQAMLDAQRAAGEGPEADLLALVEDEICRRVLSEAAGHGADVGPEPE
jgi:hypothetical protein